MTGLATPAASRPIWTPWLAALPRGDTSLPFLYSADAPPLRGEASRDGLPTFGGGGADLGADDGSNRTVGSRPVLFAQHEHPRHRSRAHRAVASREVHARIFRHLHRWTEAAWVSRRPAVRSPVRQCLSCACMARATAESCGSARSSATTGGRASSTTCWRGYRTIVVASEHMKREFVRNGVQPSQVHVNPLFPTHMERPRDSHAIVRGVRLQADHGPDEAGPDQEACVAFVGRMTVLKGGDLLVDAIALASEQLGRSIRLLMIGDGPQRTAWEQRASRRGVPWTASGWLTGDDRWTALRQATVLALPSTWPEPFGLVGLEAAALGLPAVAFDVGGIREWLRPGVNGHLAPADPPRASGLAAALVRILADPEAVERRGPRRRRGGRGDVARPAPRSTRSDFCTAHPATCAFCWSVTTRAIRAWDRRRCLSSCRRSFAHSGIHATSCSPTIWAQRRETGMRANCSARWRLPWPCGAHSVHPGPTTSSTSQAPKVSGSRRYGVPGCSAPRLSRVRTDSNTSTTSGCLTTRKPACGKSR